MPRELRPSCEVPFGIRVQPVRLAFQLLLFFMFLILSAGRDTYAEDALRVEVLPREVKQGDVFLMRVSGPASLKSVFGELRGERFLMASRGRDGAYEGLLGIDLNTRPATYEIKVVATDEGGRVYSNLLGLKVEKGEFGTQRLSLPSSMVDLDTKTFERVNKEAKRLRALFQGFQEERLWSGDFLRPVPGELTTVFGTRRIINGRPRSAHTGVDLQGEEGTPVLACNNGVVVLVDHLFFSGKSVILDHGLGLYSMYFHLSEALVSEGDRVGTGAMLGRVGSTGRSTGPHLHWGIIIRGARVDPLSLLRLTEHLRQ
jgi:murein DD-endopeptidase MepM/ murein hydrolase activator NlpD